MAIMMVTNKISCRAHARKVEIWSAQKLPVSDSRVRCTTAWHERCQVTHQHAERLRFIGWHRRSSEPTHHSRTQAEDRQWCSWRRHGSTAAVDPVGSLGSFSASARSPSGPPPTRSAKSLRQMQVVSLNPKAVGLDLDSARDSLQPLSLSLVDPNSDLHSDLHADLHSDLLWELLQRRPFHAAYG